MLTKHHGLGNDFLIAVNPPLPLGSEHARQWCDRRRGIGADGLILAVPTEPGGSNEPTESSWTMTLWNADGSRAELSGNGLRCLGQALVLNHDDGRRTATFDVSTDAGPRLVEVEADRQSDTDSVTVDMGRPRSGPPPWSRWSSVGLAANAEQGVDMGNPHLVVLVDDLATVDLAEVGPVIEADYAEGLNVEFVTVESPSEVSLRVWERGAGITEACGSGACATVWAARQWGIVGDDVTVNMPGGQAQVRMADGHLLLRGPTTFVAVVDVEHF